MKDHVLVGERLRTLREEKNLWQGEVQKRGGLVRPYISRVENGHVVPSIETVEKLARALDIPLIAFVGGLRASRPAGSRLTA